MEKGNDGGGSGDGGNGLSRCAMFSTAYSIHFVCTVCTSLKSSSTEKL